MNRKTVFYLISLIIICQSGMITAILGLIELGEKGYTFSEEIARIPASLTTMIAGLFTFIVALMHGIDHKTWEKLK